ncbi:MAG: hypothetical protein ACJAZ1_001987 [Yoonia sp.]
MYGSAAFFTKAAVQTDNPRRISNLPFAARCKNSHVVGLSSLLHAQVLLTQHPFEDAARSPLRCSQDRQGGHATRLDDVKSKLHFRCTV